MADTYKVLAQVNPSADTLTDAYTVAAATSTIISSIVVCNRSNTTVLFRISIAVAGAGDDDKQYTHYDVPLPGNETYVATIGITLAATDKVRVYADEAELSFNIFGVEKT